MSKRVDKSKDTHSISLISYVTRRLVVGPDSEFLPLINAHFDVVIDPQMGNDAALKISGTKENAAQAKEFIRQLDQKAAIYAKNERLVKTGRISQKDFEHMMVNLEHALKDSPHTHAAVIAHDDRAEKHIPPKEVELKSVFEEGAAPRRDRPKRSKDNAVKNPFHFRPKNRAQAIGLMALQDEEVSIAILAGAAGGGKTHLAVSYALKSMADYEAILMIRPDKGVGKDIGTLPGDAQEKIALVTRPFVDKIKEISGKPASDFKKIKMLTPYGERGATYNNSLVIIDEAQNLSIAEAKVLMTRIGHGSKFIICGDISSNQKDIGAEPSGLAYLIATMGERANSGDNILKNGMAFIEFSDKDSAARHPMLPSIVKAFNDPAAPVAEILRNINSERRNAALIQTIDKLDKYAQSVLTTAAERTISRYETSAKAAFPHLFGDSASNVLFLSPQTSHYS